MIMSKKDLSPDFRIGDLVRFKKPEAFIFRPIYDLSTPCIEYEEYVITEDRGEYFVLIQSSSHL